MTTTIEGRVYFHSETGTEGGLWAFQDPRFEHGPDCGQESCAHLHGRPHASYDGLLVLQDGDSIEIRHPETGEVLYRGPLRFVQQDPYGEDSRDLHGLAIRSMPFLILSDFPWVTVEEWGDWFLKEYPATFTTDRELVAPENARW